ncbi:IucA/IucC family C-terminal-domain containing protein [Bacillus sp. CECT 9360]|uniref:IucA/IucC family C-terminal-domain containing protein n=1 Tax=Bacillus sp. CECT 9360 TaxID=2845821 RepID=UPI001E3C7677|nr:IucA/IucC family C-terminal-domain containing protein [Bacillus sp. CECT 9360]CAH0344693.1 hypothetical protein BCI9360_00956 [Bacillus sp. CECT 9360]
MNHALTEQEIEALSPFRFACHADSSSFSFPATDLLRTDKLNGILLAIQKRLETPDLKVAASLLMKRYGFYAVINMYTMSVLNKKIYSPIENITFQDSGKTGWIPNIVYKDFSVVPLKSDRVKRREEVCRGTFAEHLYPVIESLSVETGLSKLIMWENIAIYLFWLYENLLEQYKDANEAETIQSDFHYLLVQAPGSIFGKLAENPLGYYYTEKIYVPAQDKQVRIRETCCFSYKISTNNNFCGGCPRICKMKG